ncbi:MAG: histidine kinase dimerization/phosphoacceptor domain -containing protein [bacterium]
MVLNFLKEVDKRFGIKIFFIFIISIFIVSFTLTIFFIYNESKHFTEELIKKGAILGELLAHNAKIGVFSENDEILVHPVKGIMQQEHVVEVSIFNPEGKLLMRAKRGWEKIRNENLFAEKGKLDTIFGQLKESGTPLYFLKKSIVEFYVPVISSSDYPTDESLFFEEKQAQENARVIGFVRIVLDRENLNSRLKSLFVNGLMIGIFFLFLGSLIAYFIAEGIVKPLNRLTASVKRIGCGSFEKIPIETDDEIGRLAEAFNTMVESLEDRNRKLNAIHKELEQRVKDRTAELSCANIKLKREVEERRRIEERVKLSLREKEVLIKELYHRTKNNMQVIRELLYIQSSYIEDEKIVQIFKDTENRIMSMALVHQKLYQSNDLSKINLNQYIGELSHALIDSYNMCSDRISLRLEIKNVLVTIDTAIPCGLIINELVSNSLKHAFPGGREGEIHISLRRSNKEDIDLLIRDNGVGAPEGFDLDSGDTLGLQLVVNLIKNQLLGTIETNVNGGLEYRIRFKEPEYKKRI